MLRLISAALVSAALISTALGGLALPAFPAPGTAHAASAGTLAFPALGTAHAASTGTLELLGRARRIELERPWRDWQARVTREGGASGRAPDGDPGAATHPASSHPVTGTHDIARERATAAFPPANVRINDSALDSAGVAQIDPVIGALGSNVLCAFTDGQAKVRPVGGVGFAWSEDGGASWTDGGAPPAPAGWSWSGHPALVPDPGGAALVLVALADSNVSDPANAWNALITIAAGFPAPGSPLWGTPHVAVRSAGSAGLFDQPALALDPLTHILDLTCVHYTALGNGIEYLASADQGASWSAPATLSDASESGAVAGPRVVDLPGVNARISVAWLSAASGGADSYRVRTSSDGGASWDPAVTVASAFHDFGSGPPGSNRGSATDFPALAVDAAPASAHHGRLYLAWQESVNWFADTLYFSPPLAALPVLESEPDDDAAHATPFAIGQTLRGTLSAGDQDWFEFAGSAGQTLVLLADSLDLSLDASLRLICTDAATRLAFSEGIAGTGYGGQLVFTLPEGGNYFVRVAEPPLSAGAGGYRVRTALHRAVAGRARDHRDLFVSHSDDGATWSAPLLLTDDPPRYDDALPELAVDGNGVAYAEWLDWRDAPAGSCGGISHTYLARSANGGDVFTSFGALADAPSAWSAVAANLAPLEGDHLALFANSDAVYPAWTDGRSGDPEIEGVTLSLTYLVTPVLISLLRADAAPAQVTLGWYEAGGLQPVTLERLVEPGDWRILATLTPDGTGFLSYVDRAIAPGARIHYRLSLLSSGSGPWFGDVEVRVPERPAFALDGAWPNPMTRQARVRFSLDSSAPAALELLDTQGRLIALEQVGSLGPGTHVVALAPRERLEPGVYLLRLTQGGRSRTGRAVVIR